MKALSFGLFLFIMAATTSSAIAQHTPPQNNKHPDHKAFRIAPLIGHTLVAVNKNEHQVIPSYGLDLEYWPSGKWGIGLHNDIELESFILVQEGKEDLERERPLVFTLDGLYKPWKNLVLVAGPGLEFDPGKTLTLLRFGLEYEFEMTHHWDLSPAFIYDTRFNAFDTWGIGLGVGKRF